MGTQIQGITSGMQELLSYHRNEAICQYCKKKLIEQGMDERKINPYKLGQDIFYLHDQIDLQSKLKEHSIGLITDIVVMDDGRQVMCLFNQHKLFICNTDGSQEVTMPVESRPCCLTPVNNSTVAVTVIQPSSNQRIEIYDINNKHKLQSIPVPGIKVFRCITMINNKLVVSINRGLVMVDYQTEEIVQNVETQCKPRDIHSSGNRIFYTDENQSKNNLHWYSFTDDKLHTLALPSIPWSMTTIQDGSLYALCKDGSVQHISSNGKRFKTLKTNQSQCFSDCHRIRYNSKQKKMFTLNISTGIAKILHEL